MEKIFNDSRARRFIAKNDTALLLNRIQTRCTRCIDVETNKNDFHMNLRQDRTE